MTLLVRGWAVECSSGNANDRLLSSSSHLHREEPWREDVQREPSKIRSGAAWANQGRAAWASPSRCDWCKGERALYPHMQPVVIESIRHPWVVHAAKLARDRRYRVRHASLLIGGHRIIQDYLCNGGTISRLAATSEYLAHHHNVLPARTSHPAFRISRHCVEHLTREAASDGILAEIPLPTEAPFPVMRQPWLSPRLLVLWTVRDPGNVGALIRSAAAFGWTVLLAGQCADHLSYEAIRCSQGYSLHVPVGTALAHQLAPHLANHTILHTAPSAVPSTLTLSSDPTTKIAVVLGNESHGLRGFPLTKRAQPCWIPTKIESLNVAIAGSILMSRFPL